MTRALLGALLAVMLCAPAHAHNLKLFAAAQGNSVGGYAFFVGGGRAGGSSWTAKDAQGRAIASGTTDGEGRFAFELITPITSDVTITVDTHEAHVASITLPAARIAGAGAAPASNSAGSLTEAGASPLQPSADRQLAVLVEAAVQRQVGPVLERVEQMDARLRFIDVLSGLFFIAGVVGTALWARARRR
ncbi:hypothetical protein [Roseomonas xinghualingensis]|uniref:hypothetical protein n=1 Tax=Roseomonas xinghualingensis TaxID=2986475 RepID=UPI0021F18C5F|nr:hypothetical protein [Roseomonas sp. SXEYE001]MCV4208180.1 hypothetical protein [Roseomonas sp. SXEYE001]